MPEEFPIPPIDVAVDIDNLSTAEFTRPDVSHLGMGAEAAAEAFRSLSVNTQRLTSDDMISPDPSIGRSNFYQEYMAIPWGHQPSKPKLGSDNSPTLSKLNNTQQRHLRLLFVWQETANRMLQEVRTLMALPPRQFATYAACPIEEMSDKVGRERREFADTCLLNDAHPDSAYTLMYEQVFDTFSQAMRIINEMSNTGNTSDGTLRDMASMFHDMLGKNATTPSRGRKRRRIIEEL